ncbi:MAG: alpha-L-fucosidase [Bacteroidales bacterium]|nr:alpha-L-fucosidase [Bacteroidales bacterium]
MIKLKTITNKFILSIILAGLISLLEVQAQEKVEQKTKWFTDARFGMFIHFGLYSVPAGVWDGEISGRNMYAEWIQKQGNWPYGIKDQEYQALAREFNPTQFNAEEWVLNAKAAGMKYIVITAKHHDGFALWPSKVSDFNVMDATPFKRDLLGELSDACKKHDIRLGFYYSHWQDWEHPGGARPPIKQFNSIPPQIQVTDKDFDIYWREKCLPQVKELIENYHPSLMWFDTWGDPQIITDKRLDELISLVRKTDPNCLINSRILMRRKGIENKVDFLSMGDNSFPTETIDMPWETSGTMNHSWGYHKLDYHWESTEGLLRKLVGNTSRNGNFQLNIGPKADGTFPAASIRRLREIGAWLFVNGKGIYNTNPNPLKNVDWGYITWKEIPEGKVNLYLHVSDWPQNQDLTLPGFSILPEKVYVLESGEELDFYPHQGLMVKLPPTPVDSRITVIVVETDSELFKKYILKTR